MDEKSYWLELEYRVCREFSGMPERSLHYWWCDGFIPKEYFLQDPTPRITGTAWICNGGNQNEWEFTLFLDKRVSSREEIDWAANLPPEEVTRWMAFDERKKMIQFEPKAAVPDLL